jgi:hypothetical protein
MKSKAPPDASITRPWALSRAPVNMDTQAGGFLEKFASMGSPALSLNTLQVPQAKAIAKRLFVGAGSKLDFLSEQN